MPAPRSRPSTTFLPTCTRSGSCPVFTGQRSIPGRVTRSGAGGGSAWRSPMIAWWMPAAVLIIAATSSLTTGSVSTSAIGPSPTSGGSTPGPTGCSEAAVPRPNTTNRGVESRFEPGPGPRRVYPVAQNRVRSGKARRTLRKSPHSYLPVPGVRHGRAAALGNDDVFASPRQNANDVRGETRPASHHVADAHLASGIGR